MKKMSLRAKMLLCILPVMAIAMVLLTYVATNQLSTEIQNAMSDTMKETVVANANNDWRKKTQRDIFKESVALGRPTRRIILDCCRPISCIRAHIIPPTPYFAPPRSPQYSSSMLIRSISAPPLQHKHIPQRRTEVQRKRLSSDLSPFYCCLRQNIKDFSSWLKANCRILLCKCQRYNRTFI